MLLPNLQGAGNLRISLAELFQAREVHGCGSKPRHLGEHLKGFKTPTAGVEPELLRMEPVCGTSPGARFRAAAAPNHPEALLEKPQVFQAVGEKLDRAAVATIPKKVP